MLASLHRRQAQLEQHVEAVPGAPLLLDLVEPDRLGDALQRLGCQLFAVEQALHETKGGAADGQRVRQRRALHARSNVGRLAEGELFGALAFADGADDHGAGVHADSHLNRHPRRQRADVREDLQSRLHTAHCVVLVRGRIAEVGQDAVPQVLRDVAFVALDDVTDRVLIGADQFVQILRVEPFRQCRGTHQVTEHDGQLTSLAFGRRRGRAGDSVGRAGPDQDFAAFVDGDALGIDQLVDEVLQRGGVEIEFARQPAVRDAALALKQRLGGIHDVGEFHWLGPVGRTLFRSGAKRLVQCSGF